MLGEILNRRKGSWIMPTSREATERVSVAIASLLQIKMELEREHKQDLAELVAKHKKDVAELEAQHKRDMVVVKNSIANLEALRAGEDLTAGRWRGMEIADSIQGFLASRPEPVPFDELMSALLIGGVELGNPKRRNRFEANVKSTINNNKKKFHYDKKKKTVRLRIQSVPAEEASA
jgi:hypothetical protein